jgi:hypothetical protein
MIPIRDENGRMAGFGARIVDPNDIPKFLNSPETPIFTKGHILYGLDRARKPIRRFFLHKVLPPFGWRAYRSLGRSWTYDERHVARLHDLIAQRQPVVGAFLHSRTFALMHYFSLPAQGRWILMCSQSRDGEAMTRIEEGLGFRVARGSSGNGGGSSSSTVSSRSSASPSRRFSRSRSVSGSSSRCW